jgi:ribonuclease HI
MVRQMNGVYKVRSPGLRPLYEQACTLARRLKWFRIEHVRREQNAEADRLANEAMDRKA